MSYRHQLELQLATKRLELKRLTNDADSLVVALHMEISPHMPVQDLHDEQIEAGTKGLISRIKRIRELKEEIRKLEEDLGIESDG